MASRPRSTPSKWTLLCLSVLLSSSAAQASIEPIEPIQEAYDDDWQEHENDNDDSLFLTTPLHNPRAIDFRDLLLPPNESTLLGGTGLQPYGDLIHTQLWPFLAELSEPDKGNFLNQQIIEPFTEAQSGVNGSLHYTEEAFGFEFQYSIRGLGDLHVKLSDIRLENLNTFLPITMMHPTREPHVLLNQFTMGANSSVAAAANNLTDSTDEALQFSIRLNVTIEGDTPLAMANVVDLHFRVPSAQILFELVVLIDTNKFLLLPIANIMDPACWINTLMHTMADDPLHQPVHLQQFQALLTSLLIDVTCVSCSPLMESFLPQLMTSMGMSIDEHMETLATSIGGFVEDAVWNMWAMVDMTRTIQELATYCPNHPDYSLPPQELGDLSEVDGVTVDVTDENVTVVAAADTFAVNLHLNDDAVGSPKLSKSSFESTLALGMLSVQTVLILASQKYLALENVPLPPPPMQIEDVTTTNNNLFDWRDFEGPMDSLRQYLTPERVNKLLQDAVLLGENNTGFSIPLPENTTFDTTLGHLVGINHIRVTGLETLSKLNVLEVLGPYELGTEVHLEKLGLAADLSFMTSNEYPGNNPILQPESMTTVFQLHDVRIYVRMMLQVDFEQFGNLQMWTLLQGFETSIPCVLASAKNTSIVDLRVTIGAMDSPVVNGYLSPDLQTMLNTVNDDLNQNHGQGILDAVPNFFQVTVRSLANEFLTEQLQLLSDDAPVCKVQNASRWDDFVDFRGLFLQEWASPYGTLLTTAYSYLQETFFNAEGVETINDRVALMTEDQSSVKGSLNLTEHGANVTTRARMGNVDIETAFQLWNMSLLNLDSLGMPFRLLYPEESYKLDSNFSVGAGSKPLTFVARMLIQASDGEEMDIHNDLNLQISLDTLAIFFKIILKMRELPFLTFPLKSMTNPYCWLALLPPSTTAIVNSTALNTTGVAMESFYWKYDDVTVDMACNDCTSPRLPELFKVLYKTGEDEYDQIEALIAEVLEGSAIRSVLVRLLQDAPSYCPHSEEYDPELVPSLPNIMGGVEAVVSDSIESTRNRNAMYLNIFFISISVLVLLCFAVSRIMIHIKNKEWKYSLSSEGRKMLDQFAEKERERDDYVDQTTASLFNSLYIPVQARYLMPLALVVDIGLFAVAHSAITFTIAVDVNLAGDDFSVDDIFEFRFLDGLRNTHQSGGHEFAIMLLVFGFVWPYMRCVLSLILWFTPPRLLSTSHRGKLLLWIDAMNKLTVIDILKFMLIIAVFFIFFGGPYIFAEAVGDLYGMTIIAIPGPAIYCTLTALLISRQSGVMMLQYHEDSLAAVRRDYHLDQLNPTSFGLVDTTARDRSAKNINKIWSDGRRNDDLEQSSHSESSADVPAEIAIPGGRYIRIFGKRILLANLGVVVAGLVIVSVVLTYLVFGPKVSIDLSAIMELIVESGTTYEEAISTFGVYGMICAVLLKARLVMESNLAYAAITCLLVAGVAALYFKVCIQLIRWVQSIYKHGFRQTFPNFFEKDEEIVKIPAYLKLHAHRHSTCWVVAFSIGVFQLGAATIYAINNFCNFLDSVYDALAYVGIIPPTSGKCWVAQMNQSHNLIVFVSCFAFLMVRFAVQLTVQYKANVRKASISLRYQQEENAFLERLGDAWKRSGRKGTRPTKRCISDNSKSKVFTVPSDFDIDDDSEGDEEEFASSSLRLVSGAPMEVVPVDEYLYSSSDGDGSTLDNTRCTAFSTVDSSSRDQEIASAEDDQETIASSIQLTRLESIDVDDVGVEDSPVGIDV